MLNREWIESVALAGLVGWYVGPGILALRAWMREMRADRVFLALESERRLRRFEREIRLGGQ